MSLKAPYIKVSESKNIRVTKFYLHDDGQFPNNALPVILYKHVLNLPTLFPSRKIIALFNRNKWSNSWKAGIFTCSHYHSITHEVLGFYGGKTILQLGGKKGMQITVKKGDVLIIPAGVAHQNLQNENDIHCVGAYPDGGDYDMNYGVAGERPKTDANITRVPIPLRDPVYGTKGALHEFWNSK